MNIQNQNIAFIGDRLFTDILMANMNGSVSIYIKPLDTSNEEIGIKIFRKIESFFFSPSNP